MSMAARFDDLSTAEAATRPRRAVRRAVGLAVPALVIVVIAGTEIRDAGARGASPAPGWPAALVVGLVLLFVAGVWAARAGWPTPSAVEPVTEEPEVQQPQAQQPEVEEPEVEEPDRPVAEGPVAPRLEEMYAALSVRASGLVDEQLVLIEDLERDESDAERLQCLYDLDHLAARVRRHADSMGALTWASAPRRCEMSLRDVLDAAVSGVRDHRRVIIEEPARRSVVSTASADVVLLVAELVDNALACSGESAVVITSTNSRGGTVVEVIDAGPGLAPEVLAEVNARFEEGADVTVAGGGGTGLFVVGRLAARHGLRVRLRPHHQVGTVASVLLPEEILVLAPPALSLLSGQLAARASKPWGIPPRSSDAATDDQSHDQLDDQGDDQGDDEPGEPLPPVALSVVRDPEPVDVPTAPRHRLGVPDDQVEAGSKGESRPDPVPSVPGRRVALGGSAAESADAPRPEGRRIRRS